MIQPLPRSSLYPYTTLFRSLSFIQCNRENYCGERMILEYKEKVDEKEIQKQQLSADYPNLSDDQMNSMDWAVRRSEEHTSELQSRGHLVCRLLLEKKKKKKE